MTTAFLDVPEYVSQRNGVVRDDLTLGLVWGVEKTVEVDAETWATSFTVFSVIEGTPEIVFSIACRYPAGRPPSGSPTKGGTRPWQQGMGDALAEAADAVGDAAGGVWDAVKGGAGDIAEGISEFVGNTVGRAFAGAAKGGAAGTIEGLGGPVVVVLVVAGAVALIVLVRR